jgi:hypothetical protein
MATLWSLLGRSWYKKESISLAQLAADPDLIRRYGARQHQVVEQINSRRVDTIKMIGEFSCVRIDD